jgi:hypothetical protein
MGAVETPKLEIGSTEKITVSKPGWVTASNPPLAP